MNNKYSRFWKAIHDKAQDSIPKKNDWDDFCEKAEIIDNKNISVPEKMNQLRALAKTFGVEVGFT